MAPCAAPYGLDPVLAVVGDAYRVCAGHGTYDTHTQTCTCFDNAVQGHWALDVEDGATTPTCRNVHGTAGREAVVCERLAGLELPAREAEPRRLARHTDLALHSSEQLGGVGAVDGHGVIMAHEQRDRAASMAQ